MANNLKDYFDALDRLISNMPMNVPKGTKISNDAVALEAGRKKGSIKKSRLAFSRLIELISAAATEQQKPRDDARGRLQKAKEDAAHYRRLWEEALAREISLHRQLLMQR